MEPNLRTHYRDVVAKGLIEEFSYENPMLVPKLEKIVVNTSIKEATTNAKLIESAAEELTLLTGQKAIIRKAKKSIANFKLREGMPIGAKVTLRGAQMWYFLERLSRSRSRASATSTESRRPASTAAATTRSVSPSSSSSPSSTTTRSRG
jgi:ribosomal protein L5